MGEGGVADRPPARTPGPARVSRGAGEVVLEVVQDQQHGQRGEDPAVVIGTNTSPPVRKTAAATGGGGNRQWKSCVLPARLRSELDGGDHGPVGLPERARAGGVWIYVHSWTMRRRAGALVGRADAGRRLLLAESALRAAPAVRKAGGPPAAGACRPLEPCVNLVS
jgi:hypothetical protein